LPEFAAKTHHRDTEDTEVAQRRNPIRDFSCKAGSTVVTSASRVSQAVVNTLISRSYYNHFHKVFGRMEEE
jgi:hypothetical protein